MPDVLQFPKKNGVGDVAPTLAVGSKGRAVQEVQGLLQQLGYDVNADGVFGPETKTAVSKFQQDNGLPVDGVVGVQTYRALASKVPGANAGTYQPVSRPGVTQGGAAASAYAPPPSIASTFTKVYAGRPLWQWGLVAAGIVGALYWLYSQTEGQVGGYRHLVKDVTPLSAPKRIRRPKSPGTEVVNGKCARVPSDGKLNAAEPLEAVA